MNIYYHRGGETPTAAKMVTVDSQY